MGIGPFGDWEEGKIRVGFISQEFGAYSLVSRVKGFVGDSMHCLTLKIDLSRPALTHFPHVAIFEVIESRCGYSPLADLYSLLYLCQPSKHIPPRPVPAMAPAINSLGISRV